MKTKLLLSTLTLGLLAGVYVWQAQAQGFGPGSKPTTVKAVGGGAYLYKIVVVRLPDFEKTKVSADQRPFSIDMDAEAEILKTLGDWEIVSAEPQHQTVPARANNLAVQEEPVMVYTLRKAK